MKVERNQGSGAKGSASFSTGAAPPGTASSSRPSPKEVKSFLIFVGPMLFLFFLFFTLPLLEGIYYSFTNWNSINPEASFIGLDNYIRIFTRDSAFQASLGRTFHFTVVNVFFTNLLAMLLAIALTSKFTGRNIFRAGIFLPNVLSMVICGFIWQFMFTKIFVNVADATGLTFLDQSWLGNPDIVIYSIVLVSLWQGVGYIMTIYIAGLQGIDDNLIEAAHIEGANGLQTFFRIKLPVMLPTVTVGVFMNVSGSLRIFDIVYSLTGGGPGNSSEVAMLDIYREAYVNNNYGYGSAKAVLLSAIIVLITALQLRFTSKREVKE